MAWLYWLPPTCYADEKVYRKRYHAIVTNQALPATEIGGQYKRRGWCRKQDQRVERRFRHRRLLHETAMRFVMVAYNLMSLFWQITHQKQPQPKLSTLRFNC
ncbi:MAG: hypothetical protein ORN54_08450, partial [Cyclobacteriaceae bacterium]|nr:hypothetical protein [Cyclobacteriaceae bacterium]